MNCQSCRERMIELADSKLDCATVETVRGHIEACPGCRKEFETLSATLGALDALPCTPPSHRLRARVMEPIESEKLTDRSHAGWAASIRAAAGLRQRRRSPWAGLALRGAGVCALVAVGFFLGERSATQRQLVELRARVDTMGQLVEQSVLQKRPSGDRLETILTAGTARKPDERVIDGLINSMAFDTSVNVRLNALSELYAHSNQEVVRAGVLACLGREPNPLVQVSMIDFLVAAKAHESSGELQKLAGDEKANPDVRDSARRAIDLL